MTFRIPPWLGRDSKNYQIIMTPPVAMAISMNAYFKIVLTVRMVKSKENLHEETSVDVVI